MTTSLNAAPGELTLGSVPHRLGYQVGAPANYTFEVSCWHDAPDEPRAVVAAITYFDASGSVIPGPYRHCQASEKFGQYQYIRASEARDVLTPCALQLAPPPNAQRVALALNRFKSKTLHLAGDCRLVEDGAAVCVDSPVQLGAWACRDGLAELDLSVWHDGEPTRNAIEVTVQWFASEEPVRNPRARLKAPMRETRLTFDAGLKSAPQSCKVRSPAPAGAQSFVLYARPSSSLVRPRVRLMSSAATLGSIGKGATLGQNPTWFSFSVDGPGSLLVLTEIGALTPLPEIPPGTGTVGLATATLHCRYFDASDQQLLSTDSAGTTPITFQLPVQPKDGRAVVDATVIPVPSATATVRLGFSSDAPTPGAHELRKGWRVLKLPAAIPLVRGRSIRRSVSVQEAWSYVLRGQLHAEGGTGAEKAALVGVRYYDANGSDVTPTPTDGYRLSPQYGMYRYLASADSAEHRDFRVELLPPPGAIRATLEFAAWETPQPVRLESTFDALEHRLRASEVPVEELLKAASQALHKAPQEVETALRAVLARNHSDVGALKLLLQLLKMQGRITEALEAAAAIHRVQGTHASWALYEHARGVVRELSPNWLPHLPVGRKPDGRPDRQRVVHFFKVDHTLEATGGSVRNHNTVRWQARVGLVPIVVTPLGYPEGSDAQKVPRYVCQDGVHYYHPHVGPVARLRSLSLDERLSMDAHVAAAIVRDQRAALIHAASGVRGYELALKALAIRASLGTPVVYEVRSLHEHTWGPRSLATELAEYTAARIRQENRCMRDADLVVTISQSMRDELVGRGIPADKIRVVPNAVDPDKFRPLRPDEELRGSLGLRGRPVLGYVSNISRREGHVTLLEAVAMLRARGTQACGLVVGTGPELPTLRARAAELGVAAHVVFTGPVAHEDVCRYYSLIDIFVVPRLRDLASDLVTPLKPFEAMAMGKTLLVSDRPALREVVEPGVRGLEFRSGSAESLASQVEVLVSNAELAARLAENGRKWVLENRTWDRNAKAYQQIYAELLDH